MSITNPNVDKYLAEGCGRCPLVGTINCSAKKWQAELQQLRAIALESGLTEDLKWSIPCYTIENKNVVLIHGFKEYCVISFFKGALLQDKKGILVQQSEHSQAGRIIRFTNIEQIIAIEDTLKAYIKDAIEIEKAGLKINYKKIEDFPIPEEFERKLAENPDLKAAFEALTPGRQRGYLLHFSQPKQAKTREARIEKCIPKIFEKKGINE